MITSISYLQIIHICPKCKGQNVDENIDHEIEYKKGKTIIKLKYSYHCNDCNLEWISEIK